MCRRVTLFAIWCVVASSASRDDTSFAHLGAGNKFFEQERFEEAAREYRSALIANPNLLSASRDLAVCRFQLREYQAAETLLSELLLHPSTAAMAHYYLGRIDLINGKLTTAITHFRSISRAQPYRDELYFLAMAYFKLAEWEDSVKTLGWSIGQNPRDFRSHQLLARALQKLGRNGAAAAEFAQTRNLLNYYTEGSLALKRCGQTLSDKNPDETARLCEPLLTTDDVDKLTALGTILGKGESFVQAEAAWKKAAALDPESPEIRYDLAITCFHLKDRICARDNAEAAIQTRPDFPEANILYASVLYTMGADEQALPALRRAHSLNPRDRSIRELLCNELVLWAEHYAHTGRISDARLLLSELDGLQPLSVEQERRLLELRQLLE